MCNQDIGSERTKNAFLEGARRKLIRGSSENIRKGVIYYFQIKINMYALVIDLGASREVVNRAATRFTVYINVYLEL
jgi:hypothetical protein